MPDTFDKLLAKGFKFVTVSELIAMNQPGAAQAGAAARRPDTAAAGRQARARTRPQAHRHAEPEPARTRSRGHPRACERFTFTASRMGTTYETPIANDYLELRAELGTALFALTTLASDSHAAPELVQTLQNLQGGLEGAVPVRGRRRGEGGQEFAAQRAVRQGFLPRGRAARPRTASTFSSTASRRTTCRSRRA